MQPKESEQNGTVSSVTRRYIELYDEELVEVRGKRASRDLEVCVGDFVTWTPSTHTLSDNRASDWEAVISSVTPPRNRLLRTYGRKTKFIASNVDLVFIATAPLPLFNTVVTDRILAATAQQGIPCILLVNKTDLTHEYTATLPVIELYRQIGLSIIELSAKTGNGFVQLLEVLNNHKLRTVVLTGVSGVGKSTILNMLLPENPARTREVSSRTGQGRQTTSQPRAYPFSREGTSHLFLIDLPGIQNFGISHLDEQEIRSAFHEFDTHAEPCRFKDCRHVNEPECNVRKALSGGKISLSRYKSYCEMLKEIDMFKDFQN